LPFRDNYFDVVYTSGVLIHIAPEDLPKVMAEMYRVSRRFIWGFEYFASTPTSIPYHGRTDLLWKRNFADAYLQQFPDLRLVKEQQYPMIGSENVSQMFLYTKADALPVER
ncbi:MAG: methyltransferase domain-containing protein, partial [bacterium]|nr:methyltransferase domain-containing protein [bacterium]